MLKINGNTDGEIQLVCKDCFYAVPMKTGIVGRFAAECRRSPPQVILVQGSPVILWPVVTDNPIMYCFEFKPSVDKNFFNEKGEKN